VGVGEGRSREAGKDEKDGRERVNTSVRTEGEVLRVYYVDVGIPRIRG